MADKALQTVFETFAKAEGSKDGKLTPDGLKKWLKDSGVIGKDTGITDADVDDAIGKACKDKKGIDFNEIKECITTIAKEKKLEAKELMEKLATSGPLKAVKQAFE